MINILDDGEQLALQQKSKEVFEQSLNEEVLTFMKKNKKLRKQDIEAKNFQPVDIEKLKELGFWGDVDIANDFKIKFFESFNKELTKIENFNNFGKIITFPFKAASVVIQTIAIATLSGPIVLSSHALAKAQAITVKAKAYDEEISTKDSLKQKVLAAIGGAAALPTIAGVISLSCANSIVSAPVKLLGNTTNKKLKKAAQKANCNLNLLCEHNR